MHIGRLGEIEEATITVETVRTQRETGHAVLFVGLYLDEDDDSEFSVFRAEQAATLNGLKNGTIDGINDETFAGLYIGVASSGEGTEEAIIKELNIQRA